MTLPLHALPRKFVSLLVVFAIPSFADSNSTSAVRVSGAAMPRATADATYGNLPLSFEANRGQADSSVRYLSHAGRSSLLLTGDSAILVLQNRPKCPAGALRSKPCSQPAPDTLKMSLSGRTRTGHAASVGAEDELPGKVNYFIGNDPSKWHTDLPTYAKVRYPTVYPGIDLVYYGNQRQLEFDFIVAPKADPNQIRLHFAANVRLAINEAGDLQVVGANATAVLHSPVIYQQFKGERQTIAGSFQLFARNTVGFSLSSYDHTQPLTIDPILVYSTLLGGSGQEYYLYYQGDSAHGIAVDASGGAYVVGTTFSADFPVSGYAYQRKNKAALAGDGSCVFISKFNAGGTAFSYSTFLCGTGQIDQTGNGDSGAAIALDAERNAYVTGAAYSPDFPVTPGAFQTVDTNTYNNGVGNFTRPTAFVTKLNATGDALVYSTYLGGSSSNTIQGSAIAVDSTGSAYVAGLTFATDFPATSGAFQTVNKDSGNGVSSAFVAKLNPSGSALDYATYLGGSGVTPGYPVVGDQAFGIAVDSQGDAFVAGQAFSTDFPVTAGAIQTVNRGAANQAPNAFVVELNPAGSAEVYGTYIGGSGQPRPACCQTYYPDGANAIALDSAGNAYVAGATWSTDFPVTAGALQTVNDGNSTGFAAKLASGGSKLLYSTYIGGDFAVANAVAVDSSSTAYITGQAGGGYVPKSLDALVNGGTTFVAKLNPAGSALNFSTEFGGSAADYAYGIALDPSENAYIAGVSYSTDFPTTAGAFQSVNRGATHGSNGTFTYPTGNAFVSKFDLSGETDDAYTSIVSISPSSKLIQQGLPLTLTVKVSSVSGSPIPGGRVTIFALTQPAPVLTLDATGTATWTSTTLPPGLYQPYVTYSGDANHLTSQTPYFSTTFRVAGPAAHIGYANGFTYGITYGEFTNLPLNLAVTDSAGYPVAGVTVSFSGAGLAFTAPSAVSNAQGGLTAYFTALKAGTLAAVASSTGIPSLNVPINVAQAPLIVILHAAQRYYGASTNPTLPVTIEGLVGTDSVTVTQQTSATAASPLGSYPVTATVSGPDAVNYSTTIQNSILNVVKAPLYISAKNVAILYGQTPPPLTAYTLSGFVNGDTVSVVSGAPTLTATVTSTTPVGFYKIGVQVGTLAAANYYFNPFSNGEGAVGVYKAPLKATANNLTMTQGSAVPTLTYSLTGFVNGQSPSVVSGAPVLNTTATSSSKPGHYPITLTVGTLSAQNYSFTLVAGILTVLP